MVDSFVRMDTFLDEERSTLMPTNTRGNHKYDEREKYHMDAFQSLDFEVIDNQILHEYNRKNTRWDYFVENGGKWLLCFWIGIFLGLSAFVVKLSVETLNDLKFEIAKHYMERHWFYGYIAYAGMGLGFALISTLIIIIVRQPLAGGSGIPEVKGYLNGVRVPNSLNVRTLCGKMISIIFSFSSGLVLGPEGPMIHIGAMLGAAVGQVKSKSLNWYPRVFWRYHNDRDRRDFISSGAAAGVAAAFGAPIGGTLFSIEEASSFWSPRLTWRTFFTCLVATFSISTLQNGGEVMVRDHGILFFGLSQTYLYRFTETIAFIILGIIGGLLGSAFVTLNVKLNRWRGKKLKKPVLRVLEVIAVSLFTTGICFGLSVLFPCRKLDLIGPPITQDCNMANYTENVVTMLCPLGEYSDMGSLLFNTPDTALQILYSRSQDVITVPVLGVACVVFFILTVLTSGIFLAGGLFIPMMLIGATAGRFFGRLLAMVFEHANPPLDPSVYALVGTAAVMGGFSRLTISLVVIIVELTESTQYLLPIIISVMVSKWIGDIFTEAHYEHLMESKSIPFLENEPPQTMMLLSVTEIMHRDVVDISMVEKVSSIVNKLRICRHGAFPIVEHDSNGKSLFRGSILRAQILVLLKHRLFTTTLGGSQGERDDPYGQTTTVVPRLSHEEFTEALAKSLPDVNQIQLTPQELSMYIDFKPYANMAATVVHDTCSYTEAYRLFRTMGLRHLFVINKHNEVVGVITRKNLL